MSHLPSNRQIVERCLVRAMDCAAGAARAPHCAFEYQREAWGFWLSAFIAAGSPDWDEFNEWWEWAVDAHRPQSERAA